MITLTIKYDLHMNTPPKCQFCMKNHKFRMTWLEKCMYYLCECRRQEQFFLDMLIGRYNLLTCIRYLREKMKIKYF